MKFRTDFVTNSSDSSFLAFNIKNDKLFECLDGLGIKFKKTNNGEFTDRMQIKLPSGQTQKIDGGNNWSYPYLNEFSSLSSWLVGMLLWEVETQYRYPPKKEEDYSEFAKELIVLLNGHDITHLDWEHVQTMNREALIPQLEEAFGSYDAFIEKASVEHTCGFEGEVITAIYTEVQNGKRTDYDVSKELDFDDDDPEPEDCTDKAIVITGKLNLFENRDEFVEYIEELDGKVVNSVSSKTDFLICNDTASSSSKMKKAKELGIPVITEEEFVRRFGDPDEFGIDEGNGDLWELTYMGGVEEYAKKHRISPCIEVWENGRWVPKAGDISLLQSTHVNDDGTVDPLANLQDMNTEEAKEYLLELLASGEIDNDEFMTLYESIK